MSPDLAFALRLLERRYLRVLSTVTLHYDRPMWAPPEAVFAETWAPWHLDGRPCFEIRVNPDADSPRAETWETALIHELVHVSQIERSGRSGGAGAWVAEWWPAYERAREERRTAWYGDEPEWDAFTARMYWRFPTERQAQTIGLALAGSPLLRDIYADPLAIAAGRLAPRWRP